MRLAFAIPLLALLACDSSPGGEVVSPPTLAVVDLQGVEAALELEPGQGLLLNFWAIWCAPCVAELPELVEVGHEYEERGGRVIGVSYDLMVPGDDATSVQPKIRDFLAGRGLDLDVLVYDADDYEVINERFGLPGEIPVTLAIDASGEVVDRQHGKADAARFEEMMRKALGL